MDQTQVKEVSVLLQTSVDLLRVHGGYVSFNTITTFQRESRLPWKRHWVLAEHLGFSKCLVYPQASTISKHFTKYS